MSKLLCLLVATLLCASSSWTQVKEGQPKTSLSKAQLAKLEERLRERVDGLYTAIQKSQWRKVESFLDDDAKIAWAPQRKIAIYGFSVKSVNVSPDGKSGITDVVMDQPLSIPGFPLMSRAYLPQTVEWAWENDDWYALIRGIPAQAPFGPGGPSLPVLTPSEAPLAKELEFSSTSYDFKLIRQGEPIRAKFYFTVKSDKAVRVKPAVFNPCECIVARVAREGSKPADGWMEFKPGDEGWIEVTMETKFFGGYVVQGLEVNVEHPEGKVLLQLTGTVVTNDRIIPK